MYFKMLSKISFVQSFNTLLNKYIVITDWNSSKRISKLNSDNETTTITTTSTTTTTTTIDLSSYDTWQWAEWQSYSDQCDQNFKKRERFCYPGQECNGTSYEVETDDVANEMIGKSLSI